MKEAHDLNLKRLLDAAADCNLTLNESKSKICVASLRMLISYQNLKPISERLQALFDLPIPSSSKELKRVCGMFTYYQGYHRSRNKNKDGWVNFDFIT